MNVPKRLHVHHEQKARIVDSNTADVHVLGLRERIQKKYLPECSHLRWGPSPSIFSWAVLTPPSSMIMFLREESGIILSQISPGIPKMYRFFIPLSLAGLTIISLSALAEPHPESMTKVRVRHLRKSLKQSHKSLQPTWQRLHQFDEVSQKKLGPLPIQTDWKGRAEKWFSSTDTAGKRKEMRTITRALKQPCKYCHTPDFKGYTDKHLISQQMMAISAEYQVACSDCHSGKVKMTPMGEIAMNMWKLAHEKKVECKHCHQPGNGFLNLTPEGRSFLESGP